MGATAGRPRHLGQALTADEAHRRLRAHADPDRARASRRFFKTGKGQYGEGDRFLGVIVPDVRLVARACGTLPSREVVRLLRSPYHEARLLAVFVLTQRFDRSGPDERARIFRLYLRHRRRINSWDLVDASAPRIVGPQLERVGRQLVYDLTRSPRLWDRRIAVLATFHLIRQGAYRDSLRLCARLLNDPEDLMHKACGWMLREVGDREPRALEGFLDRHAAVMPRTMLRYAIEHLPAAERRAYLDARTARSGSPRRLKRRRG